MNAEMNAMNDNFLEIKEMLCDLKKDHKSSKGAEIM